MAISEDTTAVVAAQLTVAWATRSGPNDRGAVGESTIVEKYQAFRRLVHERSTGYSLDKS